MPLLADRQTEARFHLNHIGRRHKPLLEVEPTDNEDPTYSHSVTSLTTLGCYFLSKVEVRPSGTHGEGSVEADIATAG